MKLFKKLYSIILAVSMLTPAAVMADDTPAETEKSEKAQILTALGIISEDTLTKEGTVTRSEFANAIVMMVNDKMPEGKSEYDLTEDDAGMSWLVDSGVITGYGDNTYLPNGEITIGQAAKISMDMLGYRLSAGYSGGYLTGYMKVARDNKILDGVAGNEDTPLTREAFVNLLYNVTECTVMEIVSVFGDGDVVYKKNDDEKTLLSVYRHIYKDTGIVEADEVSGIYSENDKAIKNHIKINGNDLKANALYDTENTLLGQNVKYYYLSDDRIYDDELICAIPHKSTSITVSSYDILSYSGGVYSYDLEGRTRTVRLNQNVITIYNGAVSDNNTVFVPKNGSVTFVDNDNDGKYDIIKIHDIKLIAVESTLNAGGTFSIYDRFNSNYNEVITDYESVDYRVYSTDGALATLTEIKSGMVVGVEKTAGSDAYYKIKLYGNTASGKLAAFESSDDILRMDDGTEYKTTARFKELFDAGDIKIKFDSAFTLYFNDFGETVYFDSEKAESPLSFRIGYVKKFVAEDDDDDGKPKIRILDESGKWRTYAFPERVKIDGKSTKRENVDLLSAVGGLMKYKLDIHGDIKEIYLPAAIPNEPAKSGMNEEFQCLFSGAGKYRYYSGGYAIGSGENVIGTKASMTVFFVPNIDVADLKETQVKVGSRSMLRDGSDYQIKLYTISDTPGIGEVALVKGGSSQEILDRASAAPIAVNSISETVDDTGEVRMSVRGVRAGGEVTILVDDQRSNKSVAPFKKGDIIYLMSDLGGMATLRDDVVDASTGKSRGYSYGVLCGYDENGKLKIYTTSNRDLVQGSWGPYFGNDTITSADRSIIGKAYDADANYLYVIKSSDTRDWSKVEAFENISWGNVYVWDESENKFRTGTIQEAKLAKYQGGAASDVFILNHNSYQVIVIYP